ncbi:MAG TPA: molybdopterin-dependent oxidoreductase, partial [Thermoanaerobaculia bacterium]|nr:molybdopterin-dependent oxidoreductase [Thermoanaerobaculia bacterium]
KETREEDGATGGQGDGESAAPPATPEAAPETKEAAAVDAGVAPIAQPEADADRAEAAPVPPPEEKPEPPPARPRPGLFEEPPEEAVEVSSRALLRQSRRDFVLFGAGAIAAAAGIWWLLPDETRSLHLTPRLRDWLDSLEARAGATRSRRDAFLGRVLTFDDDVAEALYSADRSVREYRKSQVTNLRNNYNGDTPGPGYLRDWSLTVSGLASGKVERLGSADLLARFPRREQVTRICCVEGWSAVAWWSGLRFSDFLQAFPPPPEARWASLTSSVNLDSSGSPDPYYVSIDLPTARHPQAMLATHWNGSPLPVEHGAPLRLVVPMKLGLKNIKAITSIAYSREEPPDYWAERGYSKYDGL